jgi:hypothetical protein
MLRRSLLFCSISLLLLAASSGFARNILEKKIQYVDNQGKIGQARFWVIFLGNYDVTLSKKFPGEPQQNIDASINFQIISSGYIEGNGYCAKGKIDETPAMVISTANGDRKIDLDSIDYIYDYGAKVALLSGEKGDFYMDIQGNKKMPKKFLMREYKLTNYFGEEILKEGSTEIPLAAFSLTKEGITRAQKANAALEAKQ